ncbi:MAG: hypothetical protein E7578_08585 [Ruminococcaceae bacterium]|nr:hypothetical protein [Oscillospiraceae bacterium]
MRNYIKDNLYLIVKQLGGQFLSAIMGLILSLNVWDSKHEWLIILMALFTIGFYMVVQYTGLWDTGARDRIRIDSNRLAYRPYMGFVMSLFAAIPNFILAILITIGVIFGASDGAFGYEWAGNLASISKAIAVFWEAPYDGLIMLYSPHNPIAYWLIPLPAMVAAGLGYYAGVHNFYIIKPRKKSNKK